MDDRPSAGIWQALTVAKSPLHSLTPAHACFTSISRNESSADPQWTLPRAQPTSLRWRCKCGWEPKSHHFRLSQALAYGVVKKGGCGDFILCGLSPPCFAELPASPRV
jgi:hypothetical protein